MCDWKYEGGFDEWGEYHPSFKERVITIIKITLIFVTLIVVTLLIFSIIK